MSGQTRKLSILRNLRVVVVLALVFVFVATTTYTVMSDSSVHGLSTKISYSNRYCATSTATLAKNVTFYILASVWSTSSLHTSISSATVSLMVDGKNLGASQVPPSSWDPGQYATFTLTFQDPTASPQSLPKASTLTLSVTAQASAGIASAQVTASDKTVQTFGNTSC